MHRSPPPAAVDPREMNREKLDKLLDESDDDLIRTLAARGTLGRIYGSAICASASLEENLKAKDLNDEQRDVLDTAIIGLLKELANNDSFLLDQLQQVGVRIGLLSLEICWHT